MSSEKHADAVVQCGQCGRRHDADDAQKAGGRDQIECDCGNYLVECATCGRFVSVMASKSGPGGKPVHPNCFKAGEVVDRA